MSYIITSSVMGLLILSLAAHSHFTLMNNIKTARAALEQKETEQRVSIEKTVRLIKNAK